MKFSGNVDKELRNRRNRWLVMFWRNFVLLKIMGQDQRSKGFDHKWFIKQPIILCNLVKYLDPRMMCRYYILGVLCFDKPTS